MTDDKDNHLAAYEHLKHNFIDQARNGILAFTCFTFKDYQVNWHHRAFCRALNRFAKGEVKRLMVFCPPRHGKSQLVSRQLPAFILGRNPRASVIATSYSDDLASQMNRDVQRIMSSQEYRQLFPETRIGERKADDQGNTWLKNSSIFETVGHGGIYRSAGVGGGITGAGGNFIINDDPIKNQEEADSETYRNRIWDWYTSTLYTRLEKDAGICLTLTRWHEDDLAGRLLRLAENDEAADKWEVISFPAICEAPSQMDPRDPGQPLWPEKYDSDRLMGIKASVGTRVWNAMYQQRPSPEEGNIIKREWWRFYKELPEDFDLMVQAWDLTFTTSKSSDYVVGVVMAKKGANIYLLDMVRDRLSFTDSIAAIKNLSRKWPQATAKYVERAANGYALIDTLKNTLEGIIPVKPEGSKIARANAISPKIEAGNVWLPDPTVQPWVHEVVEEWACFPAGAHDDIVDSVCYAVSKLSDVASTDWLPVSILGINQWKY